MHKLCHKMPGLLQTSHSFSLLKRYTHILKVCIPQCPHPHCSMPTVGPVSPLLETPHPAFWLLIPSTMPRREIRHVQHRPGFMYYMHNVTVCTRVHRRLT